MFSVGKKCWEYNINTSLTLNKNEKLKFYIKVNLGIK